MKIKLGELRRIISEERRLIENAEVPTAEQVAGDVRQVMKSRRIGKTTLQPYRPPPGAIVQVYLPEQGFVGREQMFVLMREVFEKYGLKLVPDHGERYKAGPFHVIIQGFAPRGARPQGDGQIVRFVINLIPRDW